MLKRPTGCARESIEEANKTSAQFEEERNSPICIEDRAERERGKSAPSTGGAAIESRWTNSPNQNDAEFGTRRQRVEPVTFSYEIRHREKHAAEYR